MCAYAIYSGKNGYHKDGLDLPPKTVVEIPDSMVNCAKGIRHVMVVNIDRKIIDNEVQKGVKILE